MRAADIVVGCCLVLATLAAFFPVQFCDFVNYDDLDYVTDNRQVQTGLTAANVRWAFTTTHASNWHPLTWLSLQLDATLFGVSSRAFHWTNLVLHCANVLLLYLALRSMTGAIWRSALVAALFALHPLHVESVAWIAERKDVLSGFFWMLTIVLYAWYARRPGWFRYTAMTIAFVLGLLAKPMLVTLPCVLLLLDWWPLGRWRAQDPPLSGDHDAETPTENEPLLSPSSGSGAVATMPEAPAIRTNPIAKRRPTLRGLVLEKVPLLALSVALCVVTVQAQHRAVNTLEKMPLQHRLLNALTAYAGYLGQMCWPADDLCVLYPHPGARLPAWQPLAAGLVLIALSVIALVTWRHHAYVLVGWLWYLGTLVPVIGFVQVGEQAMADRYTYLPLIGIFIALAWGLPDLLTGWGLKPQLMVVPTLLVLVVCAIGTSRQAAYWGNSITLWEHALKVSPNNPTAHNNLGGALLDQERDDEALDHFDATLRMQPNNSKAWNNRGFVLMQRREWSAAADCFQHALQAAPDLAVASSNLGLIRSWEGRYDEALGHFRDAVRAGQLKPKYRFHLASTLLALHDEDAAHAEYELGIRLDPTWIGALEQSARKLARRSSTLRAPEALTLALEACQATRFQRPVLLDTLAAAYAANGRFDEARRTAQQALEMAEAEGKTDLAQRIEQHLRLYEAGQRETDGH